MKKAALVKGALCVLACCVGASFPVLGYLITPKANASADASSWMAGLSDSKCLAEISLPGTHDSGAKFSIADLAGKCQDLPISEQLSIGVRFLDVRLQQDGASFAITHGFINEDLTFDSLLADCTSFLSSHPTEGLILSIKQETKAKDPKGSFNDALKARLDLLGDKINFTRTTPTLGELRGKMAILSRFEGSTFGIEAYSEWKEPENGHNTFDLTSTAPVHVQDYYKFKDVNEKIEETKACLAYAASSSSSWTINFFSGYLLGDFPPSYSVPTARAMNAWGKEHLGDYASTGTVLFDFATEELCRLVWSKNA